jgi:predicted HicB family RNase H-like nuclease
MRTSLEFSVDGSAHKEIKQKAEQQIRKYLSLDNEQDLEPYADVELKVFGEVPDKQYTAKVTVRIK